MFSRVCCYCYYRRWYWQWLLFYSWYAATAAVAVALMSNGISIKTEGFSLGCALQNRAKAIKIHGNPRTIQLEMHIKLEICAKEKKRGCTLRNALLAKPLSNCNAGQLLLLQYEFQNSYTTQQSRTLNTQQPHSKFVQIRLRTHTRRKLQRRYTGLVYMCMYCMHGESG